jgi:NitT/TauT family transport system substrate-binding protein
MTTLAALALLAMGVQAEEVVRLGNLKLAHFGAVSYIKEIAPSCGIRVEEKVFAKGLDVMQAIIAGELDVGATASEAAISGRAGGAPIVVVAGFARGGARLVARPDVKITGVAQLKRRRVGVTRGAIQEVLLMAELARHQLTVDVAPGKDVQLVYLPFADLNGALLNKQIDAMMQSEPQSSQAINRGFGIEVMKPYGTPIGEPVRTLVMTEQFYRARKPLAEKFMRCSSCRRPGPSSTTRRWPRAMCAKSSSRARSRWRISTTPSRILPFPTTSPHSTSRPRPT